MSGQIYALTAVVSTNRSQRKPWRELTAHVVRQTIGRWCCCVHTACWCVSLGSHKKPGVHRLNWLVFVMETQCVYHEVTTKLPWFSRLVAILSARWPGFNLKTVHVRFVVDKVALGQVSVPALRFPLTLSFHQCSVFAFILILFLSGQMGGSWEPSNKALLFRMSALDRQYLTRLYIQFC